MKFGGTSLQDAPAMLNVVDIVTSRKERVLVVASACASMTNLLLEASSKAGAREEKEARAAIRKIQKHHLTCAEELLAGDPQFEVVKEAIETHCAELMALSHGMAILGECSVRSVDTFASYGERLSTLLLNAAFVHRGARSVLLDVRTVMITDAAFTHAIPDVPQINERVQGELIPLFDNADVVVTQGFVGSTADGLTTTIGRGGSDYSASLLGVAAGAREIQIWTDVNGVLTADPRIVPNAQNISELTFNEASELAYFGAKVLHPETIKPAVEKAIPVRVLNSREPSHPGTLILKEVVGQSSVGVKSIAYKKGVVVLNISSMKMFLAHDYLKAVFDVFEKYETVVHSIAASQVTITVTLDDRTHLDAIVFALLEFAHVRAFTNRAIVCAVGEDLKPTPGVAGRIFTAIKDINIEMISQGASETNISFVLDEADVETAVRLLHAEFFESPVSPMVETDASLLLSGEPQNNGKKEA